MPKEQTEENLPSQAHQTSNSHPSRGELERETTVQSDDTPKAPCAYQDWASF